MLDTVRIGRQIARLRKAQNMTQPELADRMGISFQAVSNWERGASMPDIGKLPELAGIFGVTVDELLGQASPLLESAAGGRLDEYLTAGAPTPQELADAAPLLRPDQVQQAFSALPETPIGELSGLLPYLAEETVDALLLQAAAQGADGKALGEAVPFAGEAAVDAAAIGMAKSGRDIGVLAPFMSDDGLCEAAKERYAAAGLAGVGGMLPFLPDDELAALAEKEYGKNGLSGITALAPFMAEDALQELAAREVRKNGLRALAPIAPFLDEDMMDALIRTLGDADESKG